MVKDSLTRMVNETAVSDQKSTIGLLLAVLLKYGIAPIACIYLGYVLMKKDDVIQKNNDQVIVLVKDMTAATVNQTQATLNQTKVQEGLITVISANTQKISDIERDRKNHQ